MKGIDALVRTLVDGGVDTCFANPGTSEMLFVAAVDQVPELNCVLCLAEGVVTAAADGYGRMADKPAVTLLHLGVGVGNAYSSLHNARKARVPMINLVGQNGSRHLRYTNILDADIDAPLRAVSDWVRHARDGGDLPADVADAIFEANREPGLIASIVLQTDAAQGECDGPGRIREPAMPTVPAPQTVARAAELVRDGKAVIIVDGKCLREQGLIAGARIAAKTGSLVCSPMQVGRIARGGGLPPLPMFPLPVPMAQAFLKDYKAVVLVGADHPAGAFSYPGMPSSAIPNDMPVLTLAQPGEDCLAALEALVDALSARDTAYPVPAASRPDLPSGDAPLACPAINAAIAGLIPENAIICEEAGFHAELNEYLDRGPRTDTLKNTGGAIGAAIPLALGAAMACPDRPVLALQGDGGGMYNPQALWSLARQRANVTVVIYANREYGILLNELTRMGVDAPQGNARELLHIGDPDIDWVSLAQGMGVEGIRATTTDEFVAALRRGFETPGPVLVEAVI